MPSNPYDRISETAEKVFNEYAPDGGNLPDPGETYGQMRPEDPYAPTVWGQPTEFDFQTPSGQLCRMRKVDIIELMETDLLNSVDFLTGTVEKKAMPQNRAERRAAQRSDSAESSPEEAQKIMEGFRKDPEKAKDFVKVLDQVTCLCIVRPEIHPMPSEGSPLVPGRIYVKTIDFNDRIAIFNKALEGINKLQQFRGETEESERTMENVEGV